MFQNKHNWPLEHWHIEVCSKCSLKCPRCSRQEVPEGLSNVDLTLDWFKENFTGLLLKDVKKITFCGDDGDPIYAKDFIQILKWIRFHNRQVQFVIVTNGSYKTKQWWKTLATVLNDKDNIHFSLDGWDQESNSKYRVNCDWDSIITGIRCLQKSQVYKTWAAIAFKFNEDHIQHMQDLAEELKFDAFQLTLSTKFNKVYPYSYPEGDPLQPSDKYVAYGRFTRSQMRFNNHIWMDNVYNMYVDKFNDTNTKAQSIIPLCMIGNKGLYINAQGKFYPCCWTGLRYGHNKNVFDYIDREETLGQVMDNPGWKNLFQSWHTDSTLRECGEKCSVKKWDIEHATSW